MQLEHTSHGYLSSAPPPFQPLAFVELVPMWQRIIIQVLKMSVHSILHPTDHLAVATCTPAQWCREDLLLLSKCCRANARPLIVLCGLHAGCSDMGLRN